MRLIKQTWGFILTAISFAIVIYLIWYKQVNTAMAIGIMGVFVSFYFGILKYKLENDKIFKDLFVTFNERYNDELNDLLNTLRIEEDRVLKNNEIKLIVDYFNLCAEEYLWYSRNRIPTTVWLAWKAGIMENLKINQVKEVYLQETKTKNAQKSFYGLAKELNVETNNV